MEEDVEDLVTEAWGLVEGCIVGACLLMIGIAVVVLVVRAIGWMLGF